MKKRALKLLQIFSFSFFCCQLAFAEAVYLKNGRVMVGRIVEKTQEYLVLKRGEGQEAILTTIYSDDINRIQSDEEYRKTEKFVPAQLYKREYAKPWEEAATVVPVSPAGGGFAKYFKEQIQETEPPKPAPVKFPALPMLDSPQAEIGRISGYVNLPPDFKKYSGKLYVYLMKDIGKGGFSLSSGRMLYSEINKDAIQSSLIPYEIDNISVGTYKVFAYWDVSEPYIRKKTISGNEVLLGLGLKGDYMGVQLGETVISYDAPAKVVSLDCQIYISEDRLTGVRGAIEDYQVNDIYHRKQALGGTKVFLLIENFGREDIEYMNFVLFINDEKVPYGTIVVGPLKAGKEKEFDITPAYDSYVKQKEESGETVTGRPVRFKVVSTKSGYVEIEKTLFIL